MRTKHTANIVFGAFALFSASAFADSCPTSIDNDADKLMSEKYWGYWNPEVQKSIDADIEKNRKADASVKIDAPDGAKVKIEQVTHAFIFGAHIFNFNQLGSTELNDKYKVLYGTFFNSATVPFYWKAFETQPNRLRFVTEYWDTEEFWNNCPNPEEQGNWRRPSTDQLVAFCREKGIRIHGHVFVWGTRRSQNPEWVYEKFASPEEKGRFAPYILALANSQNLESKDYFTKAFAKLTPRDLSEKILPHFTKEINRLMEKRISEIAKRYGDIIPSWDVCNESARDFDEGRIVEGDDICISWYGLMPGDYPYKAFKLAEKYLPSSAKFNINDYYIKPAFAEQAKRLIARGAKIDCVGYQMHLKKPEASAEIAGGAQVQTPDQVRSNIKMLGAVGRPIHMSEITISAPGTDKRAQRVQAVIARNLYRLWFSSANVMGITWWNVVDGCGLPGEPSLSGLFERDMKPKPAFEALNALINGEWKTSESAEVKNGVVKFRGFKGKYKISWTDTDGKLHSTDCELK